MKAIQLLKKTNRKDLEASKNVEVVNLSKNRRKKIRGYNGESIIIRGGVKTKTKTVDSKNNERYHTQFVYPRDKSDIGKKLNDIHIKVNCDCGKFIYYYEVALNKNNIADIIYSNGEPPDENNPTYQVSLCKHLVKVLTLVVNKGI